MSKFDRVTSRIERGIEIVFVELRGVYGGIDVKDLNISFGSDRGKVTSLLGMEGRIIFSKVLQLIQSQKLTKVSNLEIELGKSGYLWARKVTLPLGRMLNL